MESICTKFDGANHNGSAFILFTWLNNIVKYVTLTFDSWPWKSIGFILLPQQVCVPSLTSNKPKWYYLYVVYKVKQQCWACDLDL